MEDFMMEVFNGAAMIIAGLMVGSELSIAAFVHPTLDQLPDDIHLPAASALAFSHHRSVASFANPQMPSGM